MKRTLLKFIIGCLILAIVGAITIFYSLTYAPVNLKVKHETVTSKRIHKDIDGVTVAFISDVHYGEFMDYDRLSSMVNTINDASPDIILFGGDLFHDPINMQLNDVEQKKVLDLFSNLKAPLGKFSVLGEEDLQSPDTRTFVTTFLFNAGFEDLTNKSISVHNATKESFNIVGLDSAIKGIPDVSAAFTNVNTENFTIVFTHAPDGLTFVPKENADLGFAGHTHGGQISLPLIGPLKHSEGAETYSNGTYDEGRLQIAISNGMGTSDVDMRLFSPANILLYRLKSK